MPLIQDKFDHIEVLVQISYLPEQSLPENNRFVFAYTITISNLGTQNAQLLNRHWFITDANDHVQEVVGEGVVGEQPVIAPGQSFNYTSGTMIETEYGHMHGSYQMINEDGQLFEAKIPAFTLARPHSLH